MLLVMYIVYFDEFVVYDVILSLTFLGCVAVCGCCRCCGWIVLLACFAWFCGWNCLAW